MERSITIQATAEQIKAIFFKDGEYDLFTSPATRLERRRFLWVVPIAGIFSFFAAQQPNASAIIGIATVMIIGQSVILALALNNLSKSRHQVEAYARSIEKNGPAVLRLSEVGFCLTVNGADHIERWAGIGKAIVAQDHIHILASNSYMLPKASMPEEDFDWLCEVIRSRTFQDIGDVAEREAKRPIGFHRTETGSEEA